MDILKRRLLIVMGKGGVGKSLVSALLARTFVARGERVLLVQVNTPDRIRAYLGCEPASDRIREVLPGLFSVSILPAAAMREYVLMQVKIPIIYRLVFENRAVRYFLKAVPALNDLVVLGKIIYHTEQTDREGSPVFDRVIVDAPPTGHGLFLVGLPYVMLRAVKSGPIHREARNMLDLLTDPGRCGLVLVTLPEEMPVAETIETYQTLTRDYRMPIAGLVVNQVIQPVLVEGDEARLGLLDAAAQTDRGLAQALGVAREALARRRHGEGFLRTLQRALPFPGVMLPRIYSRDFGPEEVNRLLEAFVAGIGGADA